MCVWERVAPEEKAITTITPNAVWEEGCWLEKKLVFTVQN